MIYIRDIDEENWRRIVSLSVKDEQKEFIPDPINIIAQGYIKRAYNAKVYAVANESTYIGVAMVFDVNEYDSLPPRYHFSMLMIDKQYQNQGFGTDALKAILGKLKMEKKFDYVDICVDKLNHAAFHVYTKAGFVNPRELGYPNPWDTDESITEPDCVNLLYRFTP